MSTVNLVVPTNTPYPIPINVGLAYYRIDEGTGVETSVPLEVTISAAQAEDTVVTLGIRGFGHSIAVAGGPIIYFTGPTVGDLSEQYDVSSNLTVVIPAGQTSVTYALQIGADSQVEYDRYFNVYVDSVSGGHDVSAEDLRENQRNPSHYVYDPTTSIGFNTIAIIDDDELQLGDGVVRSGSVFYIQPGNTAPLFAGDGNSTVHGSSGADIRGGLGGDLFVYGLGDQGDFIMNFNEGGVRDGFDLRPLFDAAGYTGTAPRADGTLAMLQNGADTDVYVYGVFTVRIANVVAAAIDDTYFLLQ